MDSDVHVQAKHKQSTLGYFGGDALLLAQT